MQLIIYGNKDNRYSINALLGALEKKGCCDLPVTVADNGAAATRAVSGFSGISLVGLSFFSTQLPEIVHLVRQLKTSSSAGTILIAGGAHASGDPSGTLQAGFDIAVRGEGEETFPELLEVLAKGGDLATVLSIVFRDTEGRTCLTGPRPRVDLDDYPPFAASFKRFGPIEITRGCPFACHFCQTSQLAGAGIRHRSLAAIEEAVRFLHGRRLSDVRVITPNVFAYGSEDGRIVNMGRLAALFHAVRRIIGKKGKFFAGSFPSEVRPEHVTHETMQLVKEYADNDNIVIGAQSGSQRLLDQCHRGHRVEDVERAVELAVHYGFKAYVDFIFGLPGEMEEDTEQSVLLMRRLAAMGAKVHGHTFMPLPGTAYAGQPPGRVPPRLRREIELLIAQGSAFGDWRKQEQQAREMTKGSSI